MKSPAFAVHSRPFAKSESAPKNHFARRVTSNFSIRGDDGDRTHDLRLAKPALYQLSYIPEGSQSYQCFASPPQHVVIPRPSLEITLQEFDPGYNAHAFDRFLDSVRNDDSPLLKGTLHRVVVVAILLRVDASEVRHRFVESRPLAEVTGDLR